MTTKVKRHRGRSVKRENRGDTRPRTAESQPAESTSPDGPTRKLKVFLVDDHPMVRERLAELIAEECDLEVCGEAEDGRTALKMIKLLQPDIAIVDISLKDSYGIELIKRLKEADPRVRVLVLSMHEESMYGERAIRAGASGYLNKAAMSGTVLAALRSIVNGEIFVSEKLQSMLLRKMAGSKPQGRELSIDVMTDRELEVFQLLGQGHVVGKIAEMLFLSIKTVESHREHIKQKMNFKSSHELLEYAIRYTLMREERSPRVIS